MTLNLAQRTLLQECVQTYAPDLEHLLGKIGHSLLSEDERESLREAIAEDLLASGLDVKGGHNARGLSLEELIDALEHL